jgi:hypothetical protein
MEHVIRITRCAFIVIAKAAIPVKGKSFAAPPDADISGCKQ